jgi:hypothetical protein
MGGWFIRRLSMTKKKDERAKLIERAARLVWSSLESHLTWTHKSSSEGKHFHRRCCAEYGELMHIITKLY